MNKVVIVVSGGVVRQVLSDNTHVEVEVIDLDRADTSFEMEQDMQQQLNQYESELSEVY